MRSRFIEDEEGRVFQEGARDGEALLLPAAQAGTLFPDRRGVPLWQLPDEVVCLRGLRGGDDVGFAGVRSREPDIIGDGAVKEMWPLRNPRHAGAPGRSFDLVQ